MNPSKVYTSVRVHDVCTCDGTCDTCVICVCAGMMGVCGMCVRPVCRCVMDVCGRCVCLWGGTTALIRGDPSKISGQSLTSSSAWIDMQQAVLGSGAPGPTWQCTRGLPFRILLWPVQTQTQDLC